MIVIAKRVGRLANRLILFAHFIGAAAEHDLVVYNPSLGSYARYFPSTTGRLVPRWPPKLGLPAFPKSQALTYRATLVAAAALHALQSRGLDVGLIRLRRDQRLDLNADVFLDLVRRRRVVFVQDWFFRNSDNCARHREAICSFLRPSDEYPARAEAVLAGPRKRGRFIVGVHVRQTDYASFKGGRFFYSLETYRALMERVEEAFPSRDVSFVVCSDAPIGADAFKRVDLVRGDGGECADLFTLAGCDALIGPPSTYTKWASYYGNVPLYAVSEPGRPFDATQFQVFGGLESNTDELEVWRPA